MVSDFNCIKQHLIVQGQGSWWWDGMCVDYRLAGVLMMGSFFLDELGDGMGCG
jgi:hypothetical protein